MPEVKQEGRYLGYIREWAIDKDRRGRPAFLMRVDIRQMFNESSEEWSYLNDETFYANAKIKLFRRSGRPHIPRIQSLIDSLGWNGKSLHDLAQGPWNGKGIQLMVVQEPSRYHYGKPKFVVIWVNSGIWEGSTLHQICPEDLNPFLNKFEADLACSKGALALSKPNPVH